MKTQMVNLSGGSTVSDVVLESWQNKHGDTIEKTATGLRIVPKGATNAAAPTQREHPNVKQLEAELAGTNVVASINTETGEVESACMAIVPYWLEKPAAK